MGYAPGQSAERWTLVDPTLSTAQSCVAPQQVMALVNSDWEQTASVDFDDPGVFPLFAQHRILTLLRAVDVCEAQREQHVERLLRINGTQLRILATANEAITLLHDHSIESVVLKGLASAELDYPDPRLRHMGDADIAIRPDDFQPAIRVLSDAGYREVKGTKSNFLLKGITMRSATGIEVDIHTRLFQRSPMSDILFEDTEPLQQLPSNALNVNLRLVHAAGHFILAPPGGRRLSGLIDINRIRRQPTLDLDRARQIAAHLSIEPLVGAALRLEAELSNRHDALDELDAWKAPGWLDRSTRLVAERHLLLDHLGRFREVQRADWLRYVPAWFVPDRAQRKAFTAAARRKIER